DDDTSNPNSKLQIQLTAGVKYTILVSAIGNPCGGFGDTCAGGGAFFLNPSPGGTLKPDVGPVPFPGYDFAPVYKYLVPFVSSGSAIAPGEASDLYMTNIDSGGAKYTVQFLGHGTWDQGSSPDPGSTPADQPTAPTPQLPFTSKTPPY